MYLYNFPYLDGTSIDANWMGLLEDKSNNSSLDSVLNEASNAPANVPQAITDVSWYLGLQAIKAVRSIETEFMCSLLNVFKMAGDNYERLSFT